MAHPEFPRHVPDLETSMDRIADSLEVHNFLLFKLVRSQQGDLSQEQEEALRQEALQATQVLRRDRLKLQHALETAPHTSTT